MGIVSLASGNLAGIALAATGFDWKSILFNVLTVTSIAALGSAIFGVMFGPISIALVGLGLGAIQADQGRRELVKALKRELVKHLPMVAQEQWQPIYSAVQECFNAYEQEVVQRINEDIAARRTELDQLLKQKETQDINREAETQRLRQLEDTIQAECGVVEDTYQTLIRSV
jgi:hypothetical protein